MTRRILALAVVLYLAACADARLPLDPARESSTSGRDAADAALPPAALHALVDDFAGEAIDSEKWSPYQLARWVSQTDRLVITPSPNTAGYGGLISRLPHGFAGSHFLAEISQVAGGSASTETFIAVSSLDEEEYLVITNFNGRLSAWRKWRGEPYYRVGAEVAFNPSAHRFRRIREQGGVVYFELSANGTSWTRPSGWSIAHGLLDLGDLYGAVGAGPWNSSNSNPTPAHFENVNTTVPAIPRNLAAALGSPTQIVLSWEDHAVNETGFRIERRSGGGAFVEIATVGSNATQYQDSGLAAATIYEYRVRGFNASGNSGYTKTARATTPPGSAGPAAPWNMTATVQTTERIDLRWTDNSNDESGFELQRRAGDGVWSTVVTRGPNATSYRDAGLQEGTSYTYRVRAFNGNGASAWSNEASGTTRPAAPSNLASQRVSPNAITLSWSDNSNGETGFEIQRAQSGGNFKGIAVVGANVTSFTSAGLSAGQTYRYRVRAFNSGGKSTWSNETVPLAVPQ